MPQTFDAVGKAMIDEHPADWPAWLGLPCAGPVERIDSDVSTVTAAADRVLKVDGPPEYLLDVELKTGPDAKAVRRALKYNVLFGDKHSLPVHTVMVLLRPAADQADLTGLYVSETAGGRCRLEFRYDVVRVWRRPVGPVLAGGLGILPLAPICDVPRSEVPQVVRTVDERIRQEADSPEHAGKLVSATLILMGLRFPRDYIADVVRGMKMFEDEDNTFVQLLTERGRTKEARTFLLMQGTDRFGPADKQVQAALQAEESVERLERMGRRMFHAKSWSDLLATP